MPEPRRGWIDEAIHAARRNDAVRGVVRLYKRVVPMLFALFVAAPIGLVILPFFVPKFVRSAQRRTQYGVKPLPTPAERIPTSKTIGGSL